MSIYKLVNRRGLPMDYFDDEEKALQRLYDWEDAELVYQDGLFFKRKVREAMRLNTKTAAIDLTKEESRTLEKAKTLLLLLGKHGDGALSEAADAAADKIGEVVRALEVPETVPA